MLNRITAVIITIFAVSGCTTQLKSDYTGGITKDTLIGATWQQINSDFNGTYQRWFFMDSNTVVQSQRGATLYYSWQPYTIIGTVQPNPDNQAVFYLSSGIPGGTLEQYLFVWFINAQGTTAVFQIYTTPEDVTRLLVNLNGISGPNYQKILP